MTIQYFCYLEKQSSFFLVIEAIGFMTVSASIAEWLTGKSGQQYVMTWYLAYGYMMYVSINGMVMIGSIGLLCKSVIVTGKDTLASNTLKANAHSTNASEKVNKPK